MQRNPHLHTHTHTWTKTEISECNANQTQFNMSLVSGWFVLPVFPRAPTITRLQLAISQRLLHWQKHNRPTQEKIPNNNRKMIYLWWFTRPVTNYTALPTNRFRVNDSKMIRTIWCVRGFMFHFASAIWLTHLTEYNLLNFTFLFSKA